MIMFAGFTACILAFTLSSCDPCKNLECAFGDHGGQFSIVDKNTGEDLVFGPNKIYDNGKIQFYGFIGPNKFRFNHHAVKHATAPFNSILTVDFYPTVDTAYLDLGNGDVDTLEIRYSYRPTKCCGVISDVTSFRFNNSLEIPGGKGPQVIKK